MAEWLLWIRDIRAQPLTGQQVVEQLSDRLAMAGLELIGNPMRVIPVERHPFEWTLRVTETDPGDLISVTGRATNVLESRKFALLVPAQKQRPLPKNRPAPRGF